MSDIVDIGTSDHVGQIRTDMFRASAEHALTHLANNRPPEFLALTRAGQASVDGMLSHVDSALERMQRLRHADVIDADNAAHWLAGMMTREPDRMLWHVERADGIGASGVWNYVIEDRGGRAHLSCARLEDERRLFMRFPEEATTAMERGTYLESVLRGAAHKLYGLRTDDAAMGAFSAAVVVPSHPWMKGNPDDIATQVSRPDFRMVIDYKCPSEEHDEPESVADYYVSQTHQYGLMSSQSGFPIHQMQIVNLILPQDMSSVWTELVKADPEVAPSLSDQLVHMINHKIEGVGVQIQNVKLDRSLVMDIRRVGDVADARVQQGEVSPWPPRPEKIAVDQDTQHRLNVLEAQYISATSTAKAAESRKAVIRDELKQIGAAHELGDGKAPIDLVDVKATRKVLPQPFADLLEAAGEDPSGSFGKGDVNVSRLLQHLEQKHPEIDVEQFRMRGSLIQKEARKALDGMGLTDDQMDTIAPIEITAKVTMKRKGPIAERKQEIEALVTEQVETAIDLGYGMNGAEDLEALIAPEPANEAEPEITTPTRSAGASPTP